mmetsp:Transcript_11474/g.18718  ORF Transcript_11474/g.18718 Transcript_11474/m.18718 type:complete len:254 (+) Transcript_11474:18-779(+)
MASYINALFGWDKGSQSSTSMSHPSQSRNPRGYCDFRPQLFYQEVQTWHLAGSALEFKINMTSGINQARFANDLDLEDPGSEDALASAIRNATVLVKDTESHDEGEVSKRLMNAVTWQDSAQVEYILRSCYVTLEAASPALAEASSRGFSECVSVLLNAGASPSDYLLPLSYSPQQCNTSMQKNALHFACEGGHEDCAMLLISSMHSEEEVYKKSNPSALTAFDMLRKQDLNAIARRLELHAKSHLQSKTSNS